MRIAALFRHIPKRVVIEPTKVVEIPVDPRFIRQTVLRN